MRPTIWSLFEPHYKQNLYANPKRTAKSSSRYLYDTPELLLVQIIFSCLLAQAAPAVRRSEQFAPIDAPLHLTTSGSRQAWPLCASKSSAATGPQVPAA